MVKSKIQPVQSQDTLTLKKKTADSFGFEWKRFHELKSEKGFLEFIGPIDKNFFKNKLVLDAGCGNGSYSYYAASYGAEVIAIDFSEAVSVAQENTKNMDVQVVRADITHPPFKEGTFDYIFSIGVLHHLPEPETGFRQLVPLLNRGGLISIWVYGRAKQWAAVYFYEPIIKITHHLPHRLLYYLCYIPAMIMEIINYIYLLLNKIHLTKLASILPFKYYAEYPFSVKLNDAFDVFATPSARYYTEKEILDWFTRVNLQEIAITTAGVAKGIKGFGIRK
ncbi:MAG: class I SAM-dependent methyltransferase [Methanoregula sp.]|nr:class I SAM-dependent methyltransferase [Methanoregula sp.]